MKNNSQSGFAIAAVIGIIALLALVGGTAYVATRNDAEDYATTTDDMDARATTTLDGGLETGTRVDANANLNADLTVPLATTSVDAGVTASTSVGGAGIKVNVGGNAGY